MYPCILVFISTSLSMNLVPHFLSVYFFSVYTDCLEQSNFSASKKCNILLLVKPNLTTFVLRWETTSVQGSIWEKHFLRVYLF